MPYKTEVVAGLPVVVHTLEPGYAERRPIYQLLWCFEYARSTPEHLADTRKLCAQLGIPSPERFT